MCNESLARITQHIDGLPAFPQASLELMRLADDPGAPMSRIVSVVNQDPALATRILRVANSSFFGLEGRVRTTERGVAVLGSHTVRSIALAMAVHEVLESHGVLSTDNGLDIWRHSWQCALASRALAASVGKLDPEVAFTAGLLHDIGKLMLVSCLREAYASVLRQHAHTGDPLATLESNEFGMHHGQVGAMLAQKWNLPAELIEVVLRHNDECSTLEDVPLLRTVAAGDVLARLSAPQASGNLFVSTSQIGAVYNSSIAKPDLYRLVMRLGAAQEFGFDDPTGASLRVAPACEIAVRIESDAIKNAVALVARSKGLTTDESLDEAKAAFVIVDSWNGDPDDNLHRIIDMQTLLVTPTGAAAPLLNVCELHEQLTAEGR